MIYNLYVLPSLMKVAVGYRNVCITVTFLATVNVMSDTMIQCHKLQ